MCEHLGALADRIDIAEEKFLRDMRSILRPSTSARTVDIPTVQTDGMGIRV